jgi:hypothetical protein
MRFFHSNLGDKILQKKNWRIILSPRFELIILKFCDSIKFAMKNSMKDPGITNG